MFKIYYLKNIPCIKKMVILPKFSQGILKCCFVKGLDIVHKPEGRKKLEAGGHFTVPLHLDHYSIIGVHSTFLFWKCWG
jgi:hypothetical protein